MTDGSRSLVAVWVQMPDGMGSRLQFVKINCITADLSDHLYNAAGLRLNWFLFNKTAFIRKLKKYSFGYDHLTMKWYN